MDASNAVFQTFAKEDANLQTTLKLLPGALHQTGKALNKVGQASEQVTPALTKLNPFAKALAPAAGSRRSSSRRRRRRSSRTKSGRSHAKSCRRSTNWRRAPRTSPNRSRSSRATFSVLNEFFNELAYNPGKGKAGFDFFLAWANHNLNSVVSNADAQWDGRAQPASTSTAKSCRSS